MPASSLCVDWVAKTIWFFGRARLRPIAWNWP